MKLKKILGSLLIGIGCIFLLVGVIAWRLPSVDNRQTQLVVASFQTPSDSWLIQLMNNGMLFAMGHVLTMLLIGAALIACGLLLSISARNDELATTQAKTAVAATGAAAATAAAIASSASIPASQPRAATVPKAARPAQDNPFARYIVDGSLPKSTATAAAEPKEEAQATDSTEPAAPAESEEKDNTQEILNTLDDIHQQPLDSQEVFIQPDYPENEDACQRVHQDEMPPAVEEPAEPMAEDLLAFNEDEIAIQAFEPAGDVDSEELSFSTSLDEVAEADFFALPVESPEADSVAVDDEAEPASPEEESLSEAEMPESISPAPEATDDRPRPVIRSTFRKSTASHDAPSTAHTQDSTKDDAEETSGETPVKANMETSMLKPAPRIKSTIGGKR